MSRAGCATLVLVCLLPSVVPARDVLPPATESLRDWAKKSRGRYAYGVYIGGKKVGWSIDEMKLGKHDGKDVVEAVSESYLRTKFDGEMSIKTEKSVILYELEGAGTILHARVTKTEDRKQTVREVVRQGNRLLITTRQDGRTLTRTIEMPKDTLALQRRFEAWLQANPQAGRQFTKYSTSWEDADVNQKEIHTFRGKKTILLKGMKTPVCLVEIDIDGGKMKAEMLSDGRLVTEELGGLQSVRLEEEAVARKLDHVVDLMTASSIVLDRPLGSARNVDSLRLELTGLDDFKGQSSHRQVFTPGKESTVLEVRRDFRLAKPQPLSKEECKRYTRTSPRLPCDHEAIRTLAKEIVGEEKNPLKAAKLLEAWVYKNLRKSYRDTAETALQVLDHKAGACQEHSMLYVALARAAGIPAREVGGLAYVKASKPLFGWHAWAEIHDGHQWVSVDPTWHEVYVDGTHIKLSEGSRDLAWANVVGKMKVKVIEVKTRSKPKSFSPGE